MLVMLLMICLLIKGLLSSCKNKTVRTENYLVMIHIGITAKIKDFEVPLFVGYFKISENQDLRTSAAIACKRYAERKKWSDFLARLKTVEVYDRQTNNELLKIEI